MEIIVNGKKIQLPGPISVGPLLALEQVRMPEMVSVELNGRILRREEFDRTILGTGDQVEFLYFMGGGA
ncbi:MAG: sulfur carrier protein ThiS [Sedimentisphaerales bacterium]|jgi:sulfur carrier protein|nr:sulfur carrier protein ThiS [Sedimentisphaerales bacterium]